MNCSMERIGIIGLGAILGCINKDLFIFGLALEENEVFLRWLLIQRAKYSQMYDKRLKGWYIDNNISPGKKFFLEQLGFEVIEIRDFNNLYQCFTEI